MRTSSNRPDTALARQLRRLAAATGLPLALLLLPLVAGAQGPGRITGVVTSEGGQPLTAVQVLIVGSTAGTVTDASGRYTLAGVAAGTHRLRAQRIGYNAQVRSVTVSAGAATTADFELVVIPTSLAAQVVVGYTTQQRRDVSDAVSGVTGEALRDQKVATVDEALRGRIAGVNVSASGEPGRPAQVIIRGQTSFGNPAPLYVVDGMYLGQNPQLNPDDIASIEVLKDASAAAQYGAQASNGVIVITTRKGRGENRLDVRSYYGVQSVPKRIDMMSSQEWAALNIQAYQNGLATDPRGTENRTAGAQAVLNGTNRISTDWQDAIFQTGAIQDHNLQFSGGTNEAGYLLSGGYTRQEGTIIRSAFDRYSFRVNSDMRRGRLSVGENVALGTLSQRGLNANLGGFPINGALRMLPTIPVRDSTRASGYGYGTLTDYTFAPNPVGLQELRNNGYRQNQVIGSTYGELALVGALKYRLNLGVNYQGSSGRDFIQSGVIRLNDALQPSSLRAWNDERNTLLLENLLTYDADMGRSRMNAVAGYTQQSDDFTPLQAYREGYTDPSLQTINAGSTSNLSNAGMRVQSHLTSFLARANYAFADRYLLTGTLRRDGSSRFSPSNKWGNFGAISAGWVMSEEGFYKSIPVIGTYVNYVKARASYGVLGNQNIGDYAFTAPIDQNVNYISGGTILPGATQFALANPDLKWESKTSQNVGFDFGLLGDRLTATTDYYVAKSTDLLVGVPLAWSLGADPGRSPVVNAGSVRSSGFELGLTHHVGAQGTGFRMNSTLNLTTTKNRVLSLGSNNSEILIGVSRTAPGLPIGEFWVRQTAGLFQSAADVTSWTSTVKDPVTGATRVSVLQPNAQPGDIRYVDINGDGKIDNADRYAAGNPTPSLTAGLFFDGGIRQFDFGVNFRGAFGGKIFNAQRAAIDGTADNSNYRRALDPWTPTHTNARDPRVVFGPAGLENALYESDRWIESGNYVRIQNVQLGYVLPDRLVQRLGIAAVRPHVYVNVQNLHTFTRYLGLDPEVLGTSNGSGYVDPLQPGVDAGQIYPNVRTFSFGLDFRL
ncbi:MAG: TonB-dependent outer membrane protein SusC/RagA [Gemmatimonadetes bacterium]|nr:TonB-dependent outer membrane protein SusC/RagA [Gemmatimonadota bacterium]